MKSYHPDDPTLVANWFDVNNPTHLKAWREVSKVGYWPMWFQELMAKAAVETHLHWRGPIEERLATAWVEHKLSKEGKE